MQITEDLLEHLLEDWDSCHSQQEYEGAASFVDFLKKEIKEEDGK